MTLIGRALAPVEKGLADITVPREQDWTVSWGWQDADGEIGLVGGYSASYAAIYKRQPWVNIVVNKLSRGIGRLPLKVYRGDDDRQRDKTSPLALLLSEPYPKGTPFALKSAIVGDLAVYGNAILVKQGGRRGGLPEALYPISPRGWAVNDNGDYIWRDPQSGREKTYSPDRVIHFRYWRPDDATMGLSPLEALRMTLAIENAAQRLGVASFANSARPSGVLSTEQDIDRDKLRELKSGIARLFGGVDKTGLPAVVTNGLKWTPTAWNMEEAAVIDFRKLTREEVATVYDIPLPVVNQLDRATFSNITEQGRWLVQHTYNVWTTMIEETLQAQLIKPAQGFADFYAEFDYSEILKGSPEQRFTAYAQALNSGWVTQNEVRAWENLPAHDDPDAGKLHRPLNLTPPPAPAATPPPQQGGNTRV